MSQLSPANPAAAPIAPPDQRLWGQGISFALAASLCIHAVIVMLSILLAWYSPPAGFSTGMGKGESPIDLGPQSSLTDLAAPAMSAGMNLETPVETGAAPESLATDAMAASADPTAPSSLDSATSGGAGDPNLFNNGGGEGGSGGGSGLEGGGGGSARFFGVEARGSRFAYLCDISGSMGEGGRLEALKTALTASIEGLSEGSQFSIILFSSNASALTGSKWVNVSDKTKKEARVLIAGIAAQGGTLPLPGFDLAFNMKPRPDAVYFMTDGQFGEGREEETVAQIMSMNGRAERKCPIHCITLVEISGQKIMKEIARRSGGKYTHVNGTRP